MQDGSGVQLGWDGQTLARACGEQLREFECGTAFGPVASVVADSRDAVAGSVYVARIGENSDGHRFIAAAYNAGARGFIVTDMAATRTQLTTVVGTDIMPEDVCVVLVHDATRALGELAKFHVEQLRARQQVTVVAITGSAGKTTTKDLCATLLSTLGPTLAPRGSFNNEVGLPLTVLQAGADTRYLVLEMGASALGEIAYLTRIAPPDIAVELLVGHAHLGGFGGQEQVARAKAELLADVDYAVLNAADPYVRAMPGGRERLYFGVCGDAAVPADLALTVSATGLAADALDRYAFELHVGDASARVQLGLSGRHNVNNALAAAAVASLCGMGAAAIARALDRVAAASAHRLHIFDVHGVTVIDDSYNANPESMAAALQIAGRISRQQRDHAGAGANGDARGRVLAVIGQMLELGDESAQLHHEVGVTASAVGVEHLIAVGQAARQIRAGVGDCGWTYCETADDALEALCQIMRSGDTVLIKGSNGSRVWAVADALQELAADADGSLHVDQRNG